MNVIDIYPENKYSCFVCQEVFISLEELFLLWFCSEGCKLRFAYLIVKSTFPEASETKQIALARKVSGVCLK